MQQHRCLHCTRASWSATHTQSCSGNDCIVGVRVSQRYGHLKLVDAPVDGDVATPLIVPIDGCQAVRHSIPHRTPCCTCAHGSRAFLSTGCSQCFSCEPAQRTAQRGAYKRVHHAGCIGHNGVSGLQITPPPTHTHTRTHTAHWTCLRRPSNVRRSRLACRPVKCVRHQAHLCSRSAAYIEQGIAVRLLEGNGHARDRLAAFSTCIIMPCEDRGRGTAH